MAKRSTYRLGRRLKASAKARLDYIIYMQSGGNPAHGKVPEPQYNLRARFDLGGELSAAFSEWTRQFIAGTYDLGGEFANRIAIRQVLGFDAALGGGMTANIFPPITIRPEFDLGGAASTFLAIRQEVRAAFAGGGVFDANVRPIVYLAAEFMGGGAMAADVEEYVPPAEFTAQVLIVAGGGGGGSGVNGAGGGGGGGGVHYDEEFEIDDVLTIRVGVGGVPFGAGGQTYIQKEGDYLLRCFGGTTGGSNNNGGQFLISAPLDYLTIGAGTGGGGQGSNTVVREGGIINVNDPTMLLGGVGGSTNSVNTAANAKGGGGGSGGSNLREAPINGANATNTTSGAGAAGVVSDISGDTVRYSSGGSGGALTGTAGNNPTIGATGGTGPAGVGGDGLRPGCGGGGGSGTGSGGKGADGIVIIRYPGPARAIGGDITTVGTDTIHTFGAGTHTFTVIGEDPDVTAIIDAMDVAPSPARRALINLTVAKLKESGSWDYMDVLYFTAAHTEQAARINWKSPGDHTITGDVDYIEDHGIGYGGGQSTTGWVPAAQGNWYGLSGVGAGVYLQREGATGVILRAHNTVGGIQRLQFSGNTTDYGFIANRGNGPRSAGVISPGLYMGARVAANNAERLYYNNTLVTELTGNPPTGIPDLPVDLFVTAPANDQYMGCLFIGFNTPVTNAGHRAAVIDAVNGYIQGL